jgi:cytochrome c oxidase subunit 2
MTFLFIIIAVLVAVFFVQIGKARELASAIREDNSEEYENNNFQAAFGMVFMVGFLVICVVSFIYYIPYILGWGPNTAASKHGPSVDYMFNITLFFTAIVFFACQFLLFYFGWKFRGRKGVRAKYWSHDERLEMVWMLIPAIVMTFLVVGGLRAWNTAMADVSDKEIIGKDYIEIEATGQQFNWTIRYPGRDNKLGTKHFTKITGTNPLGQDWTDEKNIDDFQPSTEIVLPVGKKVRVRINSKDVLHNFYLPQFRVKMDAVPGMPTYFVFTPTVTSDSMRARYKKYDHWNIPDKKDETKKRYEAFEYELACAELCGRGHYSMKRIIKIVTEEEYENWIDEQEKNSHYLANVYKDDKSPIKAKADEFVKLLENKEKVKTALKQVSDLASKATASEAEKLNIAITEIKAALKITRKTLNLQESDNATAKALSLSASILPKENTEDKDKAPQDSVKTEPKKAI